MKTDKFIGIFTGTKSTCKLSDLQNSKEIYYRIFFHSGIMGLAHSYADAINKPDPTDLTIFLAENIRILACVPTISNYSNEEQKQLLQIESNFDLRQAFINSLVAKFKPIFTGEKMMQDFWAEEEIKSQLLKRMDTHPTDTSEDIDLFTNGLDIEYCPPAIYEDLFRYMGEQIDKASTDFRNNELGCLQFINRVVTLMFKDSFMDVNYCKKISVYLFRDLLINYPSTNFPGKTVTQVKGSDLSAAVIKENTEKVDDSYLDADLQQVIQQQKIQRKQSIPTQYTAPVNINDLIGKVISVWKNSCLFSGTITKINTNQEFTVLTIDSGKTIKCETWKIESSIELPDYDTDCLRFDTCVDDVSAVIPFGQTVYNPGDAGDAQQQVAKFEIPSKTYQRKNGSVCQLVFCGAFALGEFYTVNLNQRKRCAGKYMSLPFKASRNTIAQFPSKKIVKVVENEKTLYRYVTVDVNDFYQFCEDNFDMIKEPRAMWEVR